MSNLFSNLTPVTTQFDRAVDAEAVQQPLPKVVTVAESELSHLPVPVARYLRRAGVVGRPRVHNFVVEMDAELCRGPGQPWMQTPVLQKGDTVLVDSAAICDYLEETVDRVPLLGAGPEERAEARRLIAWFDQKFYAEVTAPLLGERRQARGQRRATNQDWRGAPAQWRQRPRPPP
jgi:hypothetical protein